MKLSENEKRVLWAIQNDADLPVARLQKLTGHRPTTITRIISRLKNKRIIARIPVINLSRLGYTEYNVFFSLSVQQPGKRQKIKKLLIESEKVSVLLEVGGDYEFMVRICVRDAQELVEFFDLLGKTFGDIFLQKSISIFQSYTGFGKKYLTGKAAKPLVSISSERQNISIDEIDHKILKGLSQLRCSSHRDLARQIKLSNSTLDYRCKKLEAAGVLGGYIYGINTYLFGMERYRLLIHARSMTRNFRDRLFNFCATHLNIIYLIHCFGAWDFEVGVEVDEHREVPRVVRELQCTFKNEIMAIKVSPVFSLPKIVGYPFSSFSE